MEWDTITFLALGLAVMLRLVVRSEVVMVAVPQQGLSKLSCQSNSYFNQSTSG